MTGAGEPTEGRDASVHRLIAGAAEIAGGAGASLGAAATGLVFGGPEGAAAGGAIGSSAALGLRWLGREMSARLLSPREEQRVAYILVVAASRIAERIQRGERVRDDGFFADIGEDSRSDAVEVWESILTKGQREPEEAKLPYIANLLANIAFDSSVGPHLAHQIAKAGEALTYRQLCLMTLVAMKEQFSLRDGSYRGQGEFDRGLYELLFEFNDLYTRGYVNFGGPVAFGPTDVNPGNAVLQGIGADIHNLMELRTIPHEDLEPVAERLR